MGLLKSFSCVSRKGKGKHLKRHFHFYSCFASGPFSRVSLKVNSDPPKPEVNLPREGLSGRWEGVSLIFVVMRGLCWIVSVDVRDKDCSESSKPNGKMFYNH